MYLLRKGTPDIASQAMESVIFSNLAGRWCGFNCVRTLAHDQDAGISRTVDDLEWAVVQMLDRNHAVKSLETRWKEHAYVAGTPHGVWIASMKEIRIAVKMWFYVCLKMFGDLSERRQAWLGAFEHFTSVPASDSKRSPWSGRDDDDSRQRLKRFLDSVGGGFSRVFADRVLGAASCTPSRHPLKMTSRGSPSSTSERSRKKGGS
jgi:hypothetical protein